MKNGLLLLILTTFAASAEQQTVTLSVPGMNCPVCPITVQKALKNTQGVSTADVEYSSKTAVVTFDDQVTDQAALTQATGEAGYPSALVKEVSH